MGATGPDRSEDYTSFAGKVVTKSISEEISQESRLACLHAKEILLAGEPKLLHVQANWFDRRKISSIGRRITAMARKLVRSEDKLLRSKDKLLRLEDKLVRIGRKISSIEKK